MRIIIDLQACQGVSSYRGIGRYSMSLAKPMIEQAVGRNHEVWLLLSDEFPVSASQIKNDFSSLIPNNKILTLPTLGPIALQHKDNELRARAAEQIRTKMISIIHPDVVHTASVFEGWLDDLAGIDLISKTSFCSAATFYDLIPFLRPDMYLSDPAYREYYYNKIDSIKNMDLLLAISESSRSEAIESLGIDRHRVINISAAVDRSFKPLHFEPKEIALLQKKYKISKSIVLYVPGGFDPRKNFDRLFEAFSDLPNSVRCAHQLVIGSLVPDGLKEHFFEKIRQYGLTEDEVVFTGYVNDEDLVALYNLCKLMVFPSLHEGFGLPVLEAMTCGAAVIASNTTSIPEVIGLNDALFNPSSVESITSKLKEALTDERFLQKLRDNARVQANKFSWDRSAHIALEAFENNVKECAGRPKEFSMPIENQFNKVNSIVSDFNLITGPTKFDFDNLIFRLRNV